MQDYNLGFISNEDIFRHVKETVMLYSSRMDLQKFNSNLIDPIKLTFDQKVLGKSMEDAVAFECLRQEDKSNNNHIGYFHQKLFSYAGSGWEVPEAGFDVVNRNRHIFALITNKHNTMDNRSLQRAYLEMQSKLLEDKQATCMLVEVISERSQNVPWRQTLKGVQCEHTAIRKMSMDKFYEIVFGDATAFLRLCKALPAILDDVLEQSGQWELYDTVLNELRQLSPNVTDSLFKLTFGTYAGVGVFG